MNKVNQDLVDVPLSIWHVLHVRLVTVTVHFALSCKPVFRHVEMEMDMVGIVDM